MARICATCRQPLERGEERDHLCLDDLEPEDDGDEAAA